MFKRRRRRGAAVVRHVRAMAVSVMCAGTLGCQSLDNFLYAPVAAATDADLMRRATAIPPHLRQEVAGAIVSADGTPVNAWLLAHAADDGTPVARHATAIFYCHGNSRNVDLFSLRAQALWQLGYTVLLFDYRGYGKTPGLPTEAGLYADARAARAYLSTAAGGDFPAARVALYGYSLGTAVCMQMATEATAPALVLEAPFASVAQLAMDDTTLQVPQAWFTSAAYDTVGKITAHRGALLLVHGSRDTYLKPEYSVRLAAAAVLAAPKRLFIVPGADHETVPCAINRERSAEAGGCVGGYADAYLQAVAGTIDAVITPQ
jgi:fermentation-respiration switch protein FrsA (DUF1100 family)